jgi:hypothetical protein
MNDLDQMTIDDDFREYSHFHVKKATELLQPLHVPGQDPLADFSYATRQPFEAQAHVIVAAIKMLDETRGIEAGSEHVSGFVRAMQPAAILPPVVSAALEPPSGPPSNPRSAASGSARCPHGIRPVPQPTRRVSPPRAAAPDRPGQRRPRLVPTPAPAQLRRIHRIGCAHNLNLADAL